MRNISHVACRRDDGLGASNSGPYSFAVRAIVDSASADGQLPGALRFPRVHALADNERHLRGNAAYDTHLTGADATARYVTTNQATLVSK